MLRALLLAQALAWCGPLEEAFAPVLGPEQKQELGPEAKAEAMAAAMTPEQKQAARQRLEPLSAEERALGEALLSSFPQDYLAAKQHSLSQPSSEWTAAASQALAAGDNEKAGRLAAEALALDPEDEKAFGILKLSERKVGPAVIEAAALPAGFALPKDAGPTPQAVSLMGRALEARRGGDMDGTLSFALQAMRADPTSPQVQDLYRMVTADRAKQTAKVRATLSYMEAAGKARDEGRLDDAVRLAEKAAQTDPDPSTLGFLDHLRRQLQERKLASPSPKKRSKSKSSPLPLAPAGAALMALGAIGWRRYGRDAADKLKRDAALFVMAVGAGGLLYGGWLMAGAAAMGPGMGLAGGGAMAVVAVDGAAAAQGAAAAAASAKLAQAGYSLARPDNLESEDANAAFEEANTEGGKHAKNLENYRKKSTPEIIRAHRSYQKQVLFHEQKIQQPHVFAREWQVMSPLDRQRLIQKWQKDIRRNQRDADIMRGILKERGL